MAWNNFFSKKENSKQSTAPKAQAPAERRQTMPAKRPENGMKQQPVPNGRPTVQPPGTANNRVPLRKPTVGGKNRSLAVPAPQKNNLQPVEKAKQPVREMPPQRPVVPSQNTKPTNVPRPHPSQNGRPVPQNRPIPAKVQPSQVAGPPKQALPNREQTAGNPPLKAPKPPKPPRGPLVTAEGIRQTLYVLVMSILFYALACGLAVGIFYAVNRIHFNFGYDVMVELDKSQKKNEKYEMDSDRVFRYDSAQPYISLTKLASSLELSCVGDDQHIRFYKTSDLSCYVSLSHNSKQAIINGESVWLSSPVVIASDGVYVPIGLFNYYANGVHIDYDYQKRTMKVVYEVNDALSTPKRKVLEEFKFSVSAPTGIAELTEEEWFEYVGSRT